MRKKKSIYIWRYFYNVLNVIFIIKAQINKTLKNKYTKIILIFFFFFFFEKLIELHHKNELINKNK